MENSGLKRGFLELKDYNTNYAKIYEEEKKNLERIFKDKYVFIEHIGSTSIPNIKSKPIIDIIIETEDLENFKLYTEKYVEGNIYTVKKEPTMGGDYLIRKEEDGKVKAFIHVYKVGDENSRASILFRDYMISHPEEAKEYERLKLKLYEKYKNNENRREYTLGKTEYIKGIVDKAKKLRI